MILPGVSKYILVKSEMYSEILKIDTFDKTYCDKARKYGFDLAKKKRVVSLLYINDLFREIGLVYNFISVKPLILEVDLNQSNFLLSFLEGIFAHVYGHDFEFKIDKVNPLVLTGQIKTNKNQFFECVSKE